MVDNKQKTLIVIAGPTAVGKTDLCVSLAKKLDTEILNADSRQFYHEMQIGTARPTEAEMGGVKHHLMGSKSVLEAYSAGDFEDEALAILEKLFLKKDTIIMTGGSGMYIQAVCEGMDDMPSVDTTLRAQLNTQFEEEGLENLLQELKTKDPVFYQEVDQHNHKRVIRAVEVIRQTGQPFSTIRKGNKSIRPFKVVKICLERDREELYQRINLRVDLMLQAGLVQEALSLIKYREHYALKTVGYKEVFEREDGLYDHQAMVELIKRNTRRYAKKQLTWFRRDTTFNWFHPNEEDEVLNFINKELTQSNNM